MLNSSLMDFAIDLARDRLYVADLRSILVFNNISTAEGDIAPSRIVFTCCGGVGNYVGIYLDTANDRLYAAANVNLVGGAVVHVFDNVSSLSNSPPSRTIGVIRLSYGCRGRRDEGHLLRLRPWRREYFDRNRRIRRCLDALGLRGAEPDDRHRRIFLFRPCSRHVH